MPLTFYTVDCEKDGYPVLFLSPDNGYRVETFSGPFDDPGEASQEFQLTQSSKPCYLDEKTFVLKARDLADMVSKKVMSNIAGFFVALGNVAESQLFTCETCGEQRQIVNLSHFVCRECCESAGYPIETEEIS